MDKEAETLNTQWQKEPPILVSGVLRAMNMITNLQGTIKSPGPFD